VRQRAIAETLKQWRAVRGLSQRALAERAGVGYVLIARLELGQTDPRLSTLRRLAEALKIAVGELVDGEQGTGKRPARKRAGRQT
jgi:transcriptional regulator with XRE-family HTH domain